MKAVVVNKNSKANIEIVEKNYARYVQAKR